LSNNVLDVVTAPQVLRWIVFDTLAEPSASRTSIVGVAVFTSTTMRRSARVQ
jgi:hypothetical protein